MADLIQKLTSKIESPTQSPQNVIHKKVHVLGEILSMKRNLLAVLSVVFLWLSSVSAVAATMEELEGFTYENAMEKYWTTQKGDEVILWGKHSEADEEEQMIVSNVLGIYIQDGYLFAIKDADPKDNPKKRSITYLVSWYRQHSGKMVSTLSFYDDLPRYTDELAAKRAADCFEAGICRVPGSRNDGVYIFRFINTGDVELKIYPIEDGKIRSYYLTYLLGRCTTIGYHKNDFFYYVDRKYNIITLPVENMTQDIQRPRGTKMGTLPKDGQVVDGDTYLGWVTNKGVLGYTMNGETKTDMSQLPAGTEFEFYKDSIVAKFADLWLSEIVPGKEATPINEAELKEIRQNKQSSELELRGAQN